MHRKYEKNDPRPVHRAFDDAKSSLTLNDTAQMLSVNLAANRHIVSHVVHEKGIKQLIPLTHKSSDAMMSLVFYAGDGIVLKVNKADTSNKEESPLSLPAITTDRISGTDRLTDIDYDLTIRTYPYLRPGSPASRENINNYMEQIQAMGYDIPINDQEARNFRRMPDAKGTLVLIDEDAMLKTHNGNEMPEGFMEEWKAYIESIFPAYKTGKIPQQVKETDFAYYSNHDTEHGVSHFDAARVEEAGLSAIVMAETKPEVSEAASRGIWSRIMKSLGFDTDSKDNDNFNTPMPA